MIKQQIQLSDSFSYKKLLIFTLPSIVMMIFTSIYSVVDGFFVSNYVGKTPFAAVNLIMPVLMILAAVGFMIGTGGSALVAKMLGEGNREEANSAFSFLVYFAFAIGTVLAVIGFVFIRPISAALKAEGEMLECCVRYGRVVLPALPMFVLQMTFQSFFVAAEKPKIGLYATIFAGVTNMVLDWLLVAAIPLGLEGAALATSISQLVGGVFPIIYFARNNDSLLRLGKTKFYGRELLKTCVNGSSELMSNISSSLVGMMYNFQLMKYAGEDGVAAYGVLMYVNLVFLAAFIGYSIGTSPIVSYHYGAKNTQELKSLRRKSLVIITIFSVSMLALSLSLAKPLSMMFVGYNEQLMTLTCRGFSIFSFSFLFAGFAIFASGFFTALNDGVTSAAISFLRTLVFQAASVFVMPLLWGIDGIWASMIAAELMAAVISAVYLVKKQKMYGY